MLDVDVVWEDDLIGQGPADEADADDGEDDDEEAQHVFPEECGVMGVHLLAGGADDEHDWGHEKEAGFGSFGMEEQREKMKK